MNVGFVLPTALFLAALAIPIIIFYMLKLRRLPAPVSSILLWQKVLKDREANAPWQRLRRNLLLLLQLLTLALLVMALARPFVNVEARVQGNVVILLDASASMQATDVKPNRFEAAKEAAWDIVSALRPTDMVTIIKVEHIPQVLIPSTEDRAAIRDTLEDASAGYASADWSSALALAASGAAANEDTSIVVISDGAIPPDLPVMPAPTKFIQVGESGDNVGITALAVRSGEEGPRLFASMTNFGEGRVSGLAEVLVNGELFTAREISMDAAEGSREAVLSLEGLPSDTRFVEVRLGVEDDLEADNHAWAVYAAGKTARVLLVTDKNLFLERAMGLLPGLQVVKATPNQPLPETDFDMVIFDSALPEEETPLLTPEGAGSLFIIAPPRSTGLFEVGGVLTDTRIAKAEVDSPLLSYVDVNAVHVAEAQKIEQPTWARALIETEDAPLLMAGETAGRRIALLAFDVHRSDWPLQIGFPIFVANLTDWLIPGRESSRLITPGAADTIRPGDAVPLKPPPETERLVITDPSGEKHELPISESAAVPTYGYTHTPGIYRVTIYKEGPDTDEEFFAVNMPDETESDITPGQGAITGTDAGGASDGETTGRREFWWPIALAAFIMLLIEWWVYKRSNL